MITIQESTERPLRPIIEPESPPTPPSQFELMIWWPAVTLVVASILYILLWALTSLQDGVFYPLWKYVLVEHWKFEPVDLRHLWCGILIFNLFCVLPLELYRHRKRLRNEFESTFRP